jgi:hypothetical protein
MGLESMSEPDDLDLDEEEGEAVDPEGEWDENEHDDEAFFDTQSAQSTPRTIRQHRNHGCKEPRARVRDDGRCGQPWI